MVSVVLIWVYVTFTTIALGLLFSKFSEKTLGYEIKSIDGLIMCGLVISTVYAQVFSLFSGVGLIANIILLSVSILSIVLFRKRVKEILVSVFTKKRIARNIVFAVIIVVLSYFTSRGYIHYDTDLYHAQSIRWIEEYGIVKGLGNLHERFSYNSSFMALSALYSMRFLGGQSFHALSGYFALVVSGMCMRLWDVHDKRMAMEKGLRWKTQVWNLSDLLCVGAVYYIATLFDEIVSPASDYIAMLTVFYIVIRFVISIEDKKGPEQQGLLCMLAVYSTTVKLTSGLIFLLAIIPIVIFAKRKDIKKIILFLIQGIIIVIPWMTRTVIICGYLLYPFEKLDLFNVDWKIPDWLVWMDSAQIKAWGRAIYNAALVDTPFIEWFPNWFRTTLSTTEKGIIILDVIALILIAVRIVKAIIKKDKESIQILIVSIVVGASYVFWQLSAPLVRYGYAYIITLAILGFGVYIKYIKWDRVIGLLLCAYGIYKIYAMVGIGWEYRLREYYIVQEDYGKYDAYSYEINGVTFYYPTSGDQLGYDYFPSSGAKAQIAFRGDSLTDGFISYRQ